MYLEHFQLSAEPFSLTPDPAFLYKSEVHTEALAALKLGLLERRGLIAMVGEVGTGKTTLLYSLLGSLGPRIRTAYVANTKLSFDGLLRSALKDFGCNAEGATRLDLLNALNEFLLDCDRQGHTAALIVDESQNLSEDAFEELRLLSNYETYKRKLLQIVLVGQPELDEKLKRPSLRQVAERVAVRAVVNPLGKKDCLAYIEHRLTAVGGSSEIFSAGALRQIVRRSQGIPRRINVLCHNAMLFAYGRNLHRIDRRLVSTAAREREGRSLVRLGPRASASARPQREGSFFGLIGTAGLTWALTGLVVGIFGALLYLSTFGSENAARQGSPAGGAAALDRELAAHVANEPAAPADELASAIVPSHPRLANEGAVARPATAVNTEVEPAAALAPAALPARGEVGVAAAGEPTATADASQAPALPESSPAPAAPAPDPVLAPEPEVEAAAKRLPDPSPAEQSAPAEPRVVGAAERPTHKTGQPTPTDASVAIDSEIAPIAAAKPVARAAAVPAAGEPAVVKVPEGATLISMSLAVYGEYSTPLLERIRRANPHISDPNFILAGDIVRFPSLGSSNDAGADSNE